MIWRELLVKKIIILISILALLSLCVTLIACNEKPSLKDIDEFYESITNAESMELKMEIKSSEVNYIIQMMIDGDKSYYYEKNAIVGQQAIENSFYTFYEDDYLYTYTQNADGTWHSDGGHYAPENTNDAESSLNDISFIDDLLNGKNYEYSEDYGLFLSRKDLSVSDTELELELRDIELELKDGNCTIRSKAIMYGYSVDVEMYFKNVNSTTVVLPKI